MGQIVTLNGRWLDLDYKPALQVNTKRDYTPVEINGRMVHGVNINGYDYPPANPSSVLYTPGLPGQGSTIWDMSKEGNDGTLVGATWVRLASGLWVVYFDGLDDSVDYGAGIGDAATEFWASTWFCLDTDFPSGSHMNLWNKRLDGDNALWVTLNNANGQVVLYQRDSGNWKVTLGSGVGYASWTAGIWYNIFVSKSTTNGARLRVNGDVARTSADTTAVPNGGNIKAGEYGTGEDLTAKLALLQIGLTGLSSSEEVGFYQRERHLLGV